MTTANTKNSCQFFLDDEEAKIVRYITKVDALSTAAKSIVRKAIETYRRKSMANKNRKSPLS